MKTLSQAMMAVLLALALNQSANASTLQGELKVLAASLDARDQFVTALENKDFAAITQKAMGDAVDMLADDLRTTHSDEDAAATLKSIWEQNKSMFFVAQWKDLGDHSPLIPKIEDFLNQLSAKYGTIILSLPLVQDIRTLNFALPVVFHPRGQWQSPDYDNRIEYRKHFIPFANIVTYYGVLVGCNYAAAHIEGAGDLKKLCKTAAEKLKFVMGRYIAPKVSDWIFTQRNKQIEITEQNRRYNSAEELNTAIQKELAKK